MLDSQTIAQVETLFRASKQIELSAAWKRSKQREGRVLEYSSPIYVDGVLQDGVLFHGSAQLERPDQDVVFQLVVTKFGQRLHVQRLDWNPSNGHFNKGIGPDQLRYEKIVGSHIHPYRENVDCDIELLLPQQNLPIAIAIEDNPPDFNRLMYIVQDRFGIVNARSIAEPPWEPKLNL